MRSATPLLTATLLVLTASAAPAQSSWLIGGEAGYHEIHSGPSNSGAVLGVFGGRRLGVADLQASLVRGFGSDGFTAFEPTLHFRVPVGGPVSALVGGGAGLMLEDGGSVALPYSLQGGILFRVSDRMGVRALLRRGEHASLGDPGTFRGPHTFSAGLQWSM